MRVSCCRSARVVELGGGTGSTAKFFTDRLASIESMEIVDLCAPLLAQARRRADHIPQLRAIHADAAPYRPAQAVDCVVLSYALTMIPDWHVALVNAIGVLKPGGVLAAVDFHVAPACAVQGVSHGALTRRFWPRWFAHDGVHLDAAHLPELRTALPDHDVVEARAPVPYLPLVRVPYYRFVGGNPAR